MTWGKLNRKGEGTGHDLAGSSRKPRQHNCCVKGQRFFLSLALLGPGIERPAHGCTSPVGCRAGLGWSAFWVPDSRGLKKSANLQERPQKGQKEGHSLMPGYRRW